MALIVVSESVSSDDVKAKYISLSTPVITLEPSIQDDLGMTGLVWMSDYGEALNQTQLAITSPNHPLAAGLRGDPAITNTQTKYVWGNPSSAAVVAATILGNPTQAAIYAYAKGAQMRTGVAAGVRVGYFAGKDAAVYFNDSGWALFDATIAFATGRAMPTSFCSGRPDLTPCSDGNACNGAETCLAGVCATAQTLNCDDSNPCTTDMCSPQTGCVMTPKTSGSSCSDGNLCNGAETCDAAGQCNLGTSLVCNDGNDCTADTCVPATGCTAAPVPAGQSCSVANSCNVGSCSAAGSCVVDPQATNPLCSVTQLTACVYQFGSQTKAVFGYTSSGTLNVYAAAGTNANMVSPGNPNRGQPSWLKPGSNPGAFVVPLAAGETITWKVGNASSVSASTTGTPACTVSSGPEGVVLTSGGQDYLIEPLVASIAADKVLPINSDDGGGNVGPLPGQVEVGSDGGATYGVPLWVPPGRNGMQPSLSLSYHSNGDNGMLGVGWTLSGDFSVIEDCRVSRRVNPNPPRTALCLDGNPLVWVGDSYRTKIESFSKIVPVGTGYKVYQKGGRILTFTRFGAVDQNGIATSPKWAVTRIEDRFGNAMAIDYGNPPDSSEVLPRAIRYTYPLALRRVEFNYVDRAPHDVLFSNKIGYRKTTKRLESIVMYAPNPVATEPVKRYKFDYHANASTPGSDWTDTTGRTTITGRELLKSITECDAAERCRPATTFEYEHGSWTFATASIEKQGPTNYLDGDPAITGTMRVSQPVTTQWEDIDEDGLVDQVWGVLVTGKIGTLLSRMTNAAQTGIAVGPNDDLIVARYYYRKNLSSQNADGTWRLLLGPAKPLVDRFFGIGNGTVLYPRDLHSAFPYSAENPVEPMASRYPISDPVFANLDGKGVKEVYIPELIVNGEQVGGAGQPVNVNGAQVVGAGQPVNVNGEQVGGAGQPVNFKVRWRQTVWTIGGTSNSQIRNDLFQTNDVEYWTSDFQEPSGCSTVDLVSRAPGCFPSAPRIFKEVSVGDTNGDGLPELHVEKYGEPIDHGEIPSGQSDYLIDSDGDGVDEIVSFDRSQGWNSFAAWNVYDVPLQIDLNGDGIRELISDTKDPLSLWGFNRSPPQFQVTPHPRSQDPTVRYTGDRGDRVLDYDLDGRDDLIAFGSASNANISLLKGTTKRTTDLSRLGGTRVASFDEDPETPAGQKRFDIQFVDFNGDGMADMASSSGIALRQGKRPDMLVRVHRGVGPATAATTITYSPISGAVANGVFTPEGCEGGDSSTTKTRDCLRTGAWVVARLERDAGLAPTDAAAMGTRRTFEYRYVGGYRDRESGASLGFKSFEVIDKDRVVSGPNGPEYLTTKTEFFLGSNGNPSINDNPAFETPGFGFTIAGRPKRTVSRVPIGSGLAHETKTEYSYEAVAYHGGATLGVNNTKTVETFDDATGPCSIERETTTTSSFSTDPMVGGEPLEKRTISGTRAGCTANQRRHTERQTVDTYVYFSNAPSWFVGLPSRITKVMREDGRELTQVQTVTYNPATGVPDEQSVQPGVIPEEKTTTYIRNSHGLVVSQIEKAHSSFGVTPRVVTTTYDRAETIFPESVSNALGHNTTTIVHPAFGAPLWTRDLNGNITRTWYDSFFRPIQKESPNGTPQGKKLLTRMLYLLGRTASWTERSIVTQSGLCVGACAPSDNMLETTSLSYEQFDRMGRSVYTSTRNTHNNGSSDLYTSKRKFHDKFGNVIREDIAFEEASVGSVGANVPMGSRGCIDYVYDKLDRVTDTYTRGPDMAVRAHTNTFYQDLAVVVTDAVGQQRVTGSDDLGRTITASAVDGVSTLRGMMTYVYGPSGQIETATDAAGNVSQMTYDSLGRRTILNDPDTGVTTTTYNGFGEVMSETDAHGTVTTFERDLLGRTLKQHVSMPADTNTGEIAHVDTTVFVWDVGANGVAQLEHSTSADGVVKMMGYDSLGRMDKQVWVRAGVVSLISQTYDAYNRVSKVTYPSYRSSPLTATPVFVAPEAEYVYHPRDGSFLGVRDPNDVKNTDANTATEQWYFRVDERDDLGRRSKETYGNGLTARREYDQQLGFLLDLQFRNVADAPIWDLKYTYDAVGNLKRRERHAGVVGQVPYFAETFGYDAFHRMDTWQGFQRGAGQALGSSWNWQVKYGYDELGNLKDRDTFGASGSTVEQIDQVYPGTGARPHGITAMNWQQGGTGTNRAYQYDSAGRQWKRPGQTIRYTDFDLPRRIAFDGTVREANFWYDADGSRYRKEVWRSENLQDVTTYVGGLYERREQTGSAATATPLNVYYIQAGDRTVAQIEIPDGSQAQDVVKYFHQDHLDSVSFTTSSSGAMEAPVYYDPFGNRFDPTVAPVMAVASRPAGLQNVTRGFTGHEMETEDFGLINMQGRMFDPEAGRFLTADPTVQSPLWGQSYNRFMYVMGNPLTYNDPSGFSYQKTGNDQEGYSYSEEAMDNGAQFLDQMRIKESGETVAGYENAQIYAGLEPEPKEPNGDTSDAAEGVANESTAKGADPKNSSKKNVAQQAAKTSDANVVGNDGQKNALNQGGNVQQQSSDQKEFVAARDAFILARIGYAAAKAGETRFPIEKVSIEVVERDRTAATYFTGTTVDKVAIDPNAATSSMEAVLDSVIHESLHIGDIEGGRVAPRGSVAREFRESQIQLLSANRMVELGVPRNHPQVQAARLRSAIIGGEALSRSIDEALRSRK